MDAETLKAYLNITLIVPLLEEIVAGDAEAAALAKGWNCVIQMRAGEDERLAVQLQFADGRLTAAPGIHPEPTIVMDFATPQNLNANFGSGDASKPKISRGLWHIFLLMKFAKLMVFIKKYMRPRDESAMSEAALALRTRLLLRTSVLGIPAIAAFDEASAAHLKNVPDGVCRWKILPDGPAVRVDVKQGAFSSAASDAPDADARVDFKDVAAALAVLGGGKDGMKAMMEGLLNISGKTQLAMTLTPFQKRIGEILK